MYRRIILKLSGETLGAKDKTSAFDESRVMDAARVILALQNMGVETGVVLGGGNIWRGRFSDTMDAVSADQMGMLATIVNALCLEEAIRRLGGRAKTFTAQEMTRFACLYTRDAASDYLASGGVALLAGGTGNPFCTTDSAAALRAAELKADAVFKGTTVDGVYDSDPKHNPNAKKIDDVSYKRAVEEKLGVMDANAFMICMERGVKEIRVFSMSDLNNILRVASGENIGTRVHA